MTIRDEQPTDADAIRLLTAQASAPIPFIDGDEANILRWLREDYDLAGW